MSTMPAAILADAEPTVRLNAAPRPGRVYGQPAPRPGASIVLGLKVAVVMLLGLGGTAMAGAEIASWSQPDPETQVVAGDPGWSHVAGH